MHTRGSVVVLLVRIGARVAAFPVSDLIETLRPLAIESLPGLPPFVRGVSVIRGEPLPVLDLALLLGALERPIARLVTVRVGARRVAVAVEEIIGTRTIDGAAWRERPPVLGPASGEVVSMLGTLDAELLTLLQTSPRLLADLDAGLARHGSGS